MIHRKPGSGPFPALSSFAADSSSHVRSLVRVDHLNQRDQGSRSKVGHYSLFRSVSIFSSGIFYLFCSAPRLEGDAIWVTGLLVFPAPACALPIRSCRRTYF